MWQLIGHQILPNIGSFDDYFLLWPAFESNPIQSIMNIHMSGGLHEDENKGIVFLNGGEVKPQPVREKWYIPLHNQAIL